MFDALIAAHQIGGTSWFMWSTKGLYSRSQVQNLGLRNRDAGLAS
ncbi:hypothetical protein [Pacificibacter maritimus]|nr:hypothetical protein [Pacificibacter maritimus]